MFTQRYCDSAAIFYDPLKLYSSIEDVEIENNASDNAEQFYDPKFLYYSYKIQVRKYKNT